MIWFIRACIAAVLLLACSASPGLATSLDGGAPINIHSGSPCVSALLPDKFILVRDSVGQVQPFLMNTRPFTRVSTAVGAIGRLYAAVCSMRPPVRPPKGLPFMLSCNASTVEIHLNFMYRGQRELLLTAATGGCPVVMRAPQAFRGGPLWFTGQIRFCSLVAQATGIRKADLLPYPLKP